MVPGIGLRRGEINGVAEMRMGLSLACGQARFLTSSQLLAHGAEVNVGTTTVLHYAASEGRKEIAELLIAKGANVNVKDKWNWTPLKWAEYRSHGEIVERLRKHGAKE